MSNEKEKTQPRVHDTPNCAISYGSVTAWWNSEIMTFVHASGWYIFMRFAEFSLVCEDVGWPHTEWRSYGIALTDSLHFQRTEVACSRAYRLLAQWTYRLFSYTQTQSVAVGAAGYCNSEFHVLTIIRQKPRFYFEVDYSRINAKAFQILRCSSLYTEFCHACWHGVAYSYLCWRLHKSWLVLVPGSTVQVQTVDVHPLVWCFADLLLAHAGHLVRQDDRIQSPASMSSCNFLYANTCGTERPQL